MSGTDAADPIDDCATTGWLQVVPGTSWPAFSLAQDCSVSGSITSSGGNRSTSTNRFDARSGSGLAQGLTTRHPSLQLHPCLYYHALLRGRPPTWTPWSISVTGTTSELPGGKRIMSLHIQQEWRVDSPEISITRPRKAASLSGIGVRDE